MSKLYSDLKIFHFDSKLKDMSTRTQSAPIHIRLKLTNRCNHRCYYCCYRNKKLYLNQLFREDDELPRDKMKEIIADLDRMGIKAVSFSGGGEPLCYPYIGEAAEGVFNAGIKIGVLTNGSLLRGKVAEVLGNYANWVRISMDAADCQTYARIRKVSLKEFDNVCSNIYDFVRNKAKQCQLGIAFIVTQENYKDIYKFLKLMKELGVNHVKISGSVISTKADENKKYHSCLLNSAKTQIAKGFSNLSSDNFAIIDKFDNFEDTDNCYEKQYTWCPFIQCLSVIGADMNIYSCQDKAYTEKGKIGSIRDKSFQKLWSSIQAKDKLMKLNPSKDCDHHCTQHAKNLMLLDYFNLNRSHLEFV